MKYDIDLTHIDAIKKFPSLIGDIDVLINNAGIMNTETFDTYNAAKKEAILKLNLEAPIELMTVFAASLKKRKGRIINIGSVASETGQPKQDS